MSYFNRPLRASGVLFEMLAIMSLMLVGQSAALGATAASPSPAAASPSPAASHYEELLVSVSLNGVVVNENTLVLRDDAGVYYANADDVTAWNLIQKNRRSIEYKGQRYFALDDLKASFDANRGLLALTASPNAFQLNIVNFQKEAPQVPTRTTLESGGFLNYDIAHHFGTQGDGFSGSFNGAYTMFGGIASASAVEPGNGSGFVRLNTSFELDDLPQHTLLRFGDTVEAGGVLPLQRQFGGVQWGTDFTLEPSFTTTALPVFSGALPTAGTLDIIVDGRQVSQQQIPAGPFELQNMPVAPGSGNVTLVLRDASGHVQTVVSPYYESPVLLRQGISQFEFDAGSERQDYGIRSNAYGETFVAAQGRRGVSKALTLGVGIEGSAQAQAGSVAAAYIVPAIGQIAATITGRAGLDPGVQQTYTYAYQGQQFGLGAQLIKSSPLYRSDVCQLPCATTSDELVGNVSVATGKASNVSLTYAHAITTDGISSLTADLNYGRPLWRGRLNIDVLHTGPAPATTIVTASYSMQLGARGYATVSAARGDGASGPLASYNEALPNTPTGFAYELQAQHTLAAGTTVIANATAQLTNATVSQQYFRDRSSTLVATDVAGSVDFVDHVVSTARTIGQGFGVVELPGYPGVLVYVNGQEVGRTDAHGRLVLPQLQPYQANEITLAPQDLPIGVDLASSALELAPDGLSPAIARFVVKSAGGVSLILADAQGAILPTGTKIASADGKQQWIVELDGLAYLAGVAAGKQRFTATSPTATCSFELVIPKDTTQLPDFGRTVCR